MRLEVRAILVTTVALGLWYATDGIRAMTTGTLAATDANAYALLDQPGAVLLTDGRVIDYGKWAAVFLDQGVDPGLLGPIFLGIGLLGFVGLALMLLFERRRGLGWAMLLAFSLLTMVRLSFFAATGGVLAIVLLLPSTRRLVFGLKADNIGAPVIRHAPRSPLPSEGGQEGKDAPVTGDDDDSEPSENEVESKSAQASNE